MGTKKIGLGSAVSVCVGLIVATSCLVSLGTGIGLAGSSFILPLFIVLILNGFLAFSFAELHSLMPNVDGGTGQYLLTGLGPVASIVGNVSAYVITMALACSAEIAMCSAVITQMFFPELEPRVIGVILVTVFFVINCFGVDVFSKIQNFVVVLLIGSMILFGIIGVLKLGTGEVVTAAMQTTPAVTDLGTLFGLSALAFWLFIGIEFVIPVAKDMKNPKRDVLLAMVIGLALLFVVQSILGVGMSNYVSLDILAADPTGTPHMTFATNMLGTVGTYWMGIVTILAGISTMNTAYASTSKILQGMANDRMMPKALAKTNGRGAAINGLVLMGLLILGVVVSNITSTQGITFVILAASCFWLLTYILIHITVLVLRRRNPELPRNKKLILGGIPQIIGIIGNIYMIVNIESGDARTLIFKICGVLLAILVAYSFIWVCGVVKAKPFEPVDIAVINRGDITFEDLATGNKKEDKVLKA